MRYTNFIPILSLLSLIHANNIIFYEINTCNSGDYGGCYNVGENVCCYTNREGEAAAISISKGPLDFATMWSGGGCTTQQCSAGGSGTFCCIWNKTDELTGGLFVTLRSAAERANPQAAVNCTSQQAANVFGHALGDEGAWEINAENVQDEATFDQLYGEFKTVAKEEKVAWLQSHGATHKAQVHDGPVTLGYAGGVNLDA
ncbi:hypothetical protein EJ08DRAFT_308534 [Tothia fuscella]|uniref:Uncharacterized protein n=1 Tax=Tothia fuscella TaxID=1048955 RepID=A0A9P4TWW9_9PEZI|nr:hypothetical protein EJ08DRAFT_308534 [Tothia fuscella]